MAKITVYGPGCVKCHQTEEVVRQAAEMVGVQAIVEKVTDVQAIAAAGVMSTPAVAVDGEIKLAGRVPRVAEVQSWLAEVRLVAPPQPDAAQRGAEASTLLAPVPRSVECPIVVKVRIFGVQKLLDRMGTANGSISPVEFPGGTIRDLLGTLFERHGFTWADFPLLRDWHENLMIMIYRNDEIVLKSAYDTLRLVDGDFISYHIHTGCC